MSRYLTKRGSKYLRITNILDIQAASSEKKIGLQSNLCKAGAWIQCINKGLSVEKWKWIHRKWVQPAILIINEKKNKQTKHARVITATGILWIAKKQNDQTRGKIISSQKSLGLEVRPKNYP